VRVLSDLKEAEDAEEEISPGTDYRDFATD
jgi:hypothetical protein